MTWRPKPGPATGRASSRRSTSADVVIPAVKQATGGPGTATIKWEPSYLANSRRRDRQRGQRVRPGHERGARTSAAPSAPAGSSRRTCRSPGCRGRSARSAARSATWSAASSIPRRSSATVKLLGGITLSDIIDVLDVSRRRWPRHKLPKLVTERKADTVVTTYSWELAARRSGRRILTHATLFWPSPTHNVHTSRPRSRRSSTPRPRRAEGRRLAHGCKGRLIPTTSRVRLICPRRTGARRALLRIRHVRRRAGQEGRRLDRSQGVRVPRDPGVRQPAAGVHPARRLHRPAEPAHRPEPRPGRRPRLLAGHPDDRHRDHDDAERQPRARASTCRSATHPLNFRFAFCERHQPFTLTVSLFGGGGFFAHGRPASTRSSWSRRRSSSAPASR